MSLSNTNLSLTLDNERDQETVLEWLNTAVSSQHTSERIDLLHKIQEMLLYKTPWLLPQVLDDVLGFANDRNGDVKKCVVGFIEEICKQNVQLIPKVMVHLHMLLCDESVQVQKRVIQASGLVYRKMIILLSKAPIITDEMEQAWQTLNHIKVEIVNMIDSDNDGVRTNSIKFLEGIVLLQTYPAEGVQKKLNDFSLEEIPLTLKIARRRKLEEEANHIFSLLVKFHGSPHISSVNLMACMGSLCTIARCRPEFMPKVLTALENLQSNLPPTLSDSQVSSVRKQLKLQLLNVLKTSTTSEHRNAIVSLLTDLGCSYQDLSKFVPRGMADDKKRSQKRNSDVVPTTVAVKKAKYVPDVVEKEPDISEEYIQEKLTPNVAADIIFATIKYLPVNMPGFFPGNYLKQADTTSPFNGIVRLLTEQLTNTVVVKKEEAMEVEEVKEVEPIKEKKEREVKPKIIRPKIKSLKLFEVTKPLSESARKQILIESIERILQAEKVELKLSVTHMRYKIITTMASSFSTNVRETILNFLLGDIRLHMDLALAWLYEEYSLMQGFNRMPAILKREEKPDQSYNSLLCALVNNLLQSSEVKDRDGLLARLFLEAPLITDQALNLLKQICKSGVKCLTALNLMHDLVVRRPPRGLLYLNGLLECCTCDEQIVRDEAIARVLSLYERQEWQAHIEKYATDYLNYLKNNSPPECLFGKNPEQFKTTVWDDNLNRTCLSLYLSLIPYNETLIHNLAAVYIQTHADIKRTILRLLEAPIRGMGMDSPELLLLVEKCPKGSETLVTRIIHILSDRGPPSVQLVNRVRELYQARVSDVRFLIPVLNGLTKKEILAALPKLIKLNPVVVKEVFNRLLGLHGDSPISPVELLITLHTMDPSKAELKAVMKATSLCFAEKQIYTQEVLAVVIQQLMDVTPLPTLLMRTVIQSLSLYPRLTGFVMNILQRLIVKQVWRYKVIWEGFIKCCQRTKPQSFQVLLQLPQPQLKEALTMCPDMKLPLIEHIQSLSEAQKTHVPQAILDTILGETVEVQTPVITIKEEIIIPEQTNLLDEPLPPGMDVL